MRSNGLLTLVFGVWLVTTPPAVRAELLTSTTGLSGLGTYSGTIGYQASSNTSATLTIVLKNTTQAVLQGDLTAFVFNNPGDHITGATLTTAPANFSLLASPHGIDGGPYGQFDFGASTFKSFEGGGNPSLGLAPGKSGTFVFTFTGDGLEGLTTASFFSTLSVGPGNGQGDQAFVARFRGFYPEGSDKVPGVDPPAPAPEPSSLALAALGGSGLVLLAWKRKKRARQG